MPITGSNYINASDQYLEPMEMYFGLRHKDCLTLTTVTAIGGKYFDFEILTDLDGAKVLYRAWFDVDDMSTPPAADGRTLVEIEIVAGDTVAQALVKAVSELNDHAVGASYRSSESVLTIKQFYMGAVTAVTPSDAFITVVNEFTGSVEGLGATDGGVSVSFSNSTLPINADQRGEILLGELITSVGVEVTATLKELTSDQWSRIIGSCLGQTLTPVGGTKIIGMGSQAIGRNLFGVGRELLLKPVGSVDNLRNLTFFKMCPVAESATFGGTEISTMPVTFRVYLDSDINKNVDLFAFGDSHQDIQVS